LVRIRKASEPSEHELLALALGQHAVALFALERAKEADETLREQMAEWRQAFGADSIELAQKLEGQAEYVHAGFGRMESLLESLQEAARIRDLHPEVSRGKHAETLQKLAMMQMGISDYGQADANLGHAQSLLEQEIQGDSAREENKAGLAQILVLRCGLAGAFAQQEEAFGFAEAARGLKFENRVLQAETEIDVAAALATVLELFGDLPGAISEHNKILDLFRREGDMAGALDIGIIPDVCLSLTSLYVAQNNLELAGQALEAARPGGETTQFLLALSELERKRGREAEALQAYQKALRLRKENSTEVPIFFGTNRQADGNDPARFNGEVAAETSVGRAVVLVPGAQFSKEAWVPRALPVPLPVGEATNPERLFIRTAKTLPQNEFAVSAQKAVRRARLYPKSALIFVHGYNNTFEQALSRGAQLVRDLNYDGPAFVFSWPSKGNWWQYRTDRAAAKNAGKSLAAFIRSVAATNGVEKIHIIAHSMGNRVLLAALKDITESPQDQVSQKIGEVIFAAPAVPREEFSHQLDELDGRGMTRFTLYASSVDKALMVGFAGELGHVLAGYVAGARPLTHPHVDSIDVSEAGTIGLTNLNHDVFASNPVMLEDMRQLLQKGVRPPDKRLQILQPRPSGSPAEYWYYSEKPVPSPEPVSRKEP
ncbi:MAG: alpha/beta hydrolase, partial [Verrucomicrobiota bacterium]|nr:alpha/beta hydrolase [Verrucomicrobiota bacterium]